MDLNSLTTLDQLYHRVGTYHQSHECLETLRFVAAMNEFSLYNVYLLRMQRPSLRFAATESRYIAGSAQTAPSARWSSCAPSAQWASCMTWRTRRGQTFHSNLYSRSEHRAAWTA